MNDFLFFWIAWICWLFATWFMQKGTLRIQIAMISLISIVCGSHTITIMSLKINTAIIFFLCLSLYFVHKQKWVQQLYLISSSMIMTLGYVAIYLITIYDPITFVFSFTFIAPAYLFIISSLFTKKVIHKLTLIILSIALGEILIGFILNSIGLNNEIGTNHYLTRLTLTFLCIIIESLFKNIILHFERYVNRLKYERKKVV